MSHAQAAEIERLELVLHSRLAHPDYEYLTTTNGRKQEGGEPPENEGWEPNDFIDMGSDPAGKPYPRRNWERFDYHEENYWRRRKSE